MTEGWLFTSVFLAEALLHYIRWVEVLMGRKLHPTLAYIIGVLGLMVPFTFWLVEMPRDHMVIAVVLWKTIVSGGASVLICYGVDALVDDKWKSKHKIEQLELQVKVNDKSE